MRLIFQIATVVLGWAVAARTYEIKWDNNESIKKAASQAAFGLVKYYTGNNTGDTPGNLPDPYHWWETGAMFGALIDYWWLTGDDSYNKITSQALIHQAGPEGNYMPNNQTMTEGNDDQGFWVMSAMSAAEHQFPDPPDDSPGWLAQVQAVFNEYAGRWDREDCGGGLRWQIFQFNAGYGYKNSIANGCFFNIAARLAMYTGNKTYADWAEKIWDWEVSAGLINDKLQVLDGVQIAKTVGTKCTDIDKTQWSYNTGIFLHGAAVMYNFTESKSWKNRIDGLIENVHTMFVRDGIIYEQFCEMHKQCTHDQKSFKGYLARWMVATSQVAPHTSQNLTTIIKSSAKAAAKTCTGSGAANPQGYMGPPGTACGFSWLTGKFDGIIGAAPQMNALSILMYTLVDDATGPVTSKTGGTSKGNPGGGSIGPGEEKGELNLKPITTADKAGAGILTFLILFGVIGGVSFMVIEF
ncbi:hypothetical protein FoTM2_009494 [Fusarium oxysporum f. sp. vasinfectum]|uniref:Mannan endo-1,6-alpha-mannosidase n=2 Tax=Fusarium oxysporum TaxID=5507 RepID=A0A2H3TIN6_FUSOX|nr:hypothetical protein FOTG_16700 [Fusarium oxysporum f. sp. vasinfectum 25433]KAK2929155.1 hypothetical protein FoTM2_009494 [Fusarium oxysporum f. sp. vasinfectum]SCO87555.1 probable DFG5 protein [Fusarium oxysporum]